MHNFLTLGEVGWLSHGDFPRDHPERNKKGAGTIMEKAMDERGSVQAVVHCACAVETHEGKTQPQHDVSLEPSASIGQFPFGRRRWWEKCKPRA